MFNDAVWSGVESLLDNYAAIRPGDTAIVLYTKDSYEPAAWVSASLELRGVDARRILMAPLIDPGFQERLQESLTLRPVLERLVVFSFERDTMSHTNELDSVLAKYPKERRTVLRMISASAEVFSHALSVTPAELSARNAVVLAHCMRAEKLRITTKGGTDIKVRLSPRYRWISNRGAARSGGTVFLPAGEVATYPAMVTGIFCRGLRLQR
jgi:hypothetical protein